MTNEEIIKGLQAVNEHIGKHFNEGGAWMAEFIDNAIKALESQPKTMQEKQAESEKYQKAFDDGYVQARFDYGQEPSEDCISREAVNVLIDELARAISDERYYMSRGRSIATIMQDILDLPSVTPSYNSIKTELKPCEDCISRTELLAKIDEERKHLLDLKMDGAEHIIVHHARRIIEDMPSVAPQRPKGKWIPVSERLPEERGHYLITVKIDGMNGCKPYYEIQKSWYSDKQFVVEYIGDGLVARRSVVAWMPLPSSYQAESEDEE